MTDKPTTKIALSDLANLERLIDEAPARQATEVSKRRAIVMLGPKIHQLRSKGYAWREVATWLAEHGLPVSVPALQRYLRTPASRTGKPLAGSRERERAAKPSGAAPAHTPVASATSPAGASEPSQATRPAAAAAPERGAARPPVATTGRGATFTPRPDTDDL